MSATEKSIYQRTGDHWCIGRTPVIKKRELSDYFGIKHLAVKDESFNHFGTHKDRRSAAMVADVCNMDPELRPEALCILTAGNGGMSLARIAAAYEIPVTAFVDESNISPQSRTRLEEICERVIPLDLASRFWTAEELEGLASKQRGRRVWDVTNGVTGPFEAIVDEIWASDSEDLPDVIVLPVGSGELFLGVALRLKERQCRTRLFGVTVGQDSAADKLYAKWNPQRNELDTMLLNEPRYNLWRLDDERLLLDTFAVLKAIGGLSCEPSSAAAFAALHQLKTLLRPDEKVVVINTGTFNFSHEEAQKAQINTKQCLS